MYFVEITNVKVSLKMFTLLLSMAPPKTAESAIYDNGIRQQLALMHLVHS